VEGLRLRTEELRPRVLGLVDAKGRCAEAEGRGVKVLRSMRSMAQLRGVEELRPRVLGWVDEPRLRMEAEV